MSKNIGISIGGLAWLSTNDECFRSFCGVPGGVGGEYGSLLLPVFLYITEK